MLKCDLYIKIYKLSYDGTKWGLMDGYNLDNLDISDYNLIKLYDYNFNFEGVGLYPRRGL